MDFTIPTIAVFRLELARIRCYEISMLTDPSSLAESDGKPAQRSLDQRPERIAFLLFPGFSMLAFSATLDPLRMANWLSESPLYTWTLLSPDGGPVTAANGVSVQVDGSIGAARRPETLLVAASYDHEDLATPEVLAALRRWSAHGTRLGAIDSGTYILASAGLLNGYRATAHWENLEDHIERFPEIAFSQDLFVLDRDRFTAAGGTAGLDMMLNLIRDRHGEALAARAADEFIYARIREPQESQRASLRDRLGIANPRLIRAIEAMEEAIEETQPIDHFANAAGVSARELERQFRKWLKVTPGAFYRNLRLDRARHLLRHSALSVLEVALRTGFGSAAHFSRSYATRFGHPPSAERRG